MISIENVSFSYDKHQVLEDVSLEVGSGEFVGVIGPNGGGKTTLLKLIAGFMEPSKGNCFIFGNSPKVSRKKIGYVPQVIRYDKNFPISALEVVLTGCLRSSFLIGGYSKREKMVSMSALEKVGMEGYAKVALGELSGGQAQRVLVARSLVSDPKLLLLDEPTSGVDKHSSQEIYTILSGLLGDVSILMVTHNLQSILDHLSSVVCVCKQVRKYPPKEVCLHFAAGVYDHPHGLNESEESL